MSGDDCQVSIAHAARAGTQRGPKHTNGQLQGPLGSQGALLSSDFHTLAPSVEDGEADRVQAKQCPGLATIMIGAMVVVVSSIQASSSTLWSHSVA